MNKEKAITLIALVITIIVFLILAGVTVATITGENGLLSKSQLAKEKTLDAEQDEKDKLSSYENEINNYSTMPRTGEGNTNQTAKIRKNTIYSGLANTINTEYTLTDSIDNYSVLIVYAELTGASVNANVTTLVIDTSEIDYQNDDGCKFLISANTDNTTCYGIRFKFSANNKLYIGSKHVSGWCQNANYPEHYEIYKIVGIE